MYGSTLKNWDRKNFSNSLGLRSSIATVFQEQASVMVLLLCRVNDRIEFGNF